MIRRQRYDRAYALTKRYGEVSFLPRNYTGVLENPKRVNLWARDIKKIQNDQRSMLCLPLRWHRFVRKRLEISLVIWKPKICTRTTWYCYLHAYIIIILQSRENNVVFNIFTHLNKYIYYNLYIYLVHPIDYKHYSYYHRKLIEKKRKMMFSRYVKRIGITISNTSINWIIITRKNKKKINN